MTTREEVLIVAKSLHFYPTEAEIKEIIERFDEEADSDPSGYWRLWIENLLYSMEVRQVVPPAYDDSNPKPTDSDQPLIDKCIERIKQDVEAQDFTAIDELLKFVPVEYLKGFLSED